MKEKSPAKRTRRTPRLLRAGAEALVAEALKLKPDLSLVIQRTFDIAYFDKSIPEPKYALWRELGIPDELSSK